MESPMPFLVKKEPKEEKNDLTESPSVTFLSFAGRGSTLEWYNAKAMKRPAHTKKVLLQAKGMSPDDPTNSAAIGFSSLHLNVSWIGSSQLCSSMTNRPSPSISMLLLPFVWRKANVIGLSGFSFIFTVHVVVRVSSFKLLSMTKFKNAS